MAIQPTTSHLMTSQPDTTPLSKTRKYLLFIHIWCIYFLVWCGFGLWAPFFPGEALLRGVTSTEIGFIFGIYSLVGFIASLVTGPLMIPKFGPRFVLIGGLLVNGASFFTSGFGYLINNRLLFVLFCLIMRATAALGASACKTAILVIITQEFQENVILILGALEVAVGGGLSLGAVMGGFFYALGGFKLPNFVLGGWSLVYLPLVWFILTTKERSTPKKDKLSKWKLIRQTIVLPGVIAMCNAGFVCLFAYTFIDPILEEFAATFGLVSRGVSMLFLGTACSYMLASFVVGFIINKKSWNRVTIVIGSFILAVSTLFLGPAPFMKPVVPHSLWVLVSALALFGASDGILYVPILPEMLQCCQESNIGRSLEVDSILSGLATSFTSLGSFLGPVVSGVLNDHYGFPWTATIISFFLFAQSLTLMIFFTCKRRKDFEKNYQLLKQQNAESDSAFYMD